MSNGYQHVEVQGDRKEPITFHREDHPDAPVEVSINQETIKVEPRALLLAVKTVTEEQ